MFDLMARLSASGARFVIATVVATGGSSPQKPGARLVVTSDGALHGTVGGGAIEHRVVETARELLADGAEETRLLDVHLTFDLGMCCGGRMRVFLERIECRAKAEASARDATSGEGS
ncbi:MAG: XdhC family protein [Myxococcales bacterium]|jgi:xanthine dehydrogenase accessory factor